MCLSHGEVGRSTIHPAEDWIQEDQAQEPTHLAMGCSEKEVSGYVGGRATGGIHYR